MQYEEALDAAIEKLINCQYNRYPNEIRRDMKKIINNLIQAEE
jgi:hypothetical protein